MNTISGEHWTVHHSDCRAAFRALPAGSVHCVVTSPPYFGGVRDYGIQPTTWGDGWVGCYGSEPEIDRYVEHTLEVFDAVGHALRDDGVIWLNIGDCYDSGGRQGHGTRVGALQGTNAGSWGTGARASMGRQGNKMLVPFRVALALQAAGWCVRQDGIWSAHRCIKAATSAGGCCATCGAQYAPIVRREQFATRPALESKVWREDEKTAADGKRSTTSPNRDPHRKIVRVICDGYRPTCECPAGEPARPVVADPFTGSGTVLQVSINTGRQFVGSEIADHYLPLIQERAATPWAPKTEKRKAVKRRKRNNRERALFT